MSAGHDYSHVRFISAGAGSGKTWFLTGHLEQALVDGSVDPAGVIATTFTVKAAGELEQRLRQRLIGAGHAELAEQVGQALVGTVHSVCERLLQRFAFELALSPRLSVVSLEDTAEYFRQALDLVLDAARIRSMNRLAARLDLPNWQGTVKAIADLARANDIDPKRLRENGADSAAALLAHFPAPAGRGGRQALLQAVDEAVEAIDLEVDTTATTAGYVTELLQAREALAGRDCPWRVWVSLATRTAAKRSDPVAARVRTAADYARQPKLQADLRDYTRGTFDIAAEVLWHFQALKRERGLIDFTDMEQLALAALDNPQVRERLAEELDLLLVDEFQDTNPMQLALFMKLAGLARQVVFVGDVKQAIYAFRGCDANLVFATLESLTAGGGEVGVLPRSYRSRPALVHYLNAVFTDVFADIPPERVVLQPAREELTDAAAVIRWQLAGAAREAWPRLAEGVAQLVADAHPVVDPDTGEARPVRWGDVAVLAATNAHVEEIALALRACGVPMRMTLSGLLSVPEVCFAQACLRRLDDESDTLASAEIVAMGGDREPEQWLAERLDWLAAGRPSRAWGEDSHPVLAALAGMRADISHHSPVEIVARVLNVSGVREIVTRWGPDPTRAEQRHRNLDAFLGLAVEYENHCAQQHTAATLTGFLLWLENPRSPELDLQPTVTTGNAVHVLTHHRAKGMEWPVVIAADFNYTWGSRLWDVRAQTPGHGLDVSDPLAAREVRYWPDPFGRRTRNLPLRDAILASDEGQHWQAQALEEQQRQAYVAMTRARDLLVIALPERQTRGAWLDTFRTPILLPDGDEIVLDANTRVPSACLTPGDRPVTVPPREYRPVWFVEHTPGGAALPESSSPSGAAPVAGAVIAQRVEIGARVDLHNAPDMAAIGDALHAVIAAELINPGLPDAEQRAAAVIAAAGVEAYLDPGDALGCARRFRTHALEQLGARRVLAEYPVRHVLDNGQVVRGWVDALLETDAGWLVVDHKSSPKPRSAWEEEALAYSGQLAAYREALRAAGWTVAACYVHFPVTGGLLALQWPESLEAGSAAT